MNWFTKIIRRKRQFVINRVLKQARSYSTSLQSRIDMLEKHFTLFQRQGRMTEYVELYSKLSALKSARDRQNTRIVDKVKIVMV